MNIPRQYINPKYYADFQRRYKNDLKKNTIKKTKSISIKDKMENGYYVYDLTSTNKTTIQINDTIEDGKKNFFFIVIQADTDITKKKECCPSTKSFYG
jgi:hypothetical protein